MSAPSIDTQFKVITEFMDRVARVVGIIDRDTNPVTHQLRLIALAAALEQMDVYLTRLETYEPIREEDNQ